MGIENGPQYTKGEKLEIIDFSEFRESPERFSDSKILEQARNHLIVYHYAVEQFDGDPLPASNEQLDRAEREKDNWLGLLGEDEPAQVIENATDWISIKEEMEESIWPK